MMTKEDKNEETQNKKLMTCMWALLITNSLFYLLVLFLTVSILEEGVLQGIIICMSTIIFVISGFISLKIELDAGYYECKNCNHKFVPTYKMALISAHFGTTRHLKCPKCNRKSWSKKVMTK